MHLFGTREQNKLIVMSFSFSKGLVFIFALVAYVLGTYIVFTHLRLGGSLAESFGDERYSYVNYVKINYQLVFSSLFCGLKLTMINVLGQVYGPNDKFVYFMAETFIRLSTLSLLDLRLRQVPETDFHSRLSIHFGDVMAMITMALYNRYTDKRVRNEGDLHSKIYCLQIKVEKLQERLDQNGIE